MSRMRLRVSRTHFPVTALGPGTRLGIWLQGCPLACRGCMSLDTWDPAGGTSVPVTALLDLWRAAVGAGAEGTTVSGGEPLAQPGPLAELLRGIHRERTAAGPDAARHDILLYTGYEPAELTGPQRWAAALADAVITGRFEAARPTGLIWRGSANQRRTPQTELGRAAYGAYLDHTPEQPPLQVRVDASGVWLVGTPRRGTLGRLERDLRSAGLDVAAVSWRR